MQGLGGELFVQFERALEAARSSKDKGKNPLAAYISLSAKEFEKKQQSASWIFSAIAEDPDFLTPIKTFKAAAFSNG